MTVVITRIICTCFGDWHFVHECQLKLCWKSPIINVQQRRRHLNQHNDPVSYCVPWIRLVFLKKNSTEDSSGQFIALQRHVGEPQVLGLFLFWWYIRLTSSAPALSSPTNLNLAVARKKNIVFARYVENLARSKISYFDSRDFFSIDSQNSSLVAIH